MFQIVRRRSYNPMLALSTVCVHAVEQRYFLNSQILSAAKLLGMLRGCTARFGYYAWSSFAGEAKHI